MNSLTKFIEGFEMINAKKGFKKKDLFEVFTICDYYFIKPLIFAQQTLNNTEFQVYLYLDTRKLPSNTKKEDVNMIKISLLIIYKKYKRDILSFSNNTVANFLS